jgi:hypothetical protein
MTSQNDLLAELVQVSLPTITAWRLQAGILECVRCGDEARWQVALPTDEELRAFSFCTLCAAGLMVLADQGAIEEDGVIEI